MWIDAEELYQKAKENLELKSVLDKTVAADLLSGSKYDYHFYLQCNIKNRRKTTYEDAIQSNPYIRNIKLAGKQDSKINLFNRK